LRLLIPASFPSTYSLVSRLPLLFCSPQRPPPAISTLSLHDALPISGGVARRDGGRHASSSPAVAPACCALLSAARCTSSAFTAVDRKSTRLNSSHEWISYAVFCLKKKKSRPNREARTGSTPLDCDRV